MVSALSCLGGSKRGKRPTNSQGPPALSLVRVLGDWKGFTGESRLVDFKRITLQETGIGWDDVSQLDADHISWYQDCCILLTPFPIPQPLGFGGKTCHESSRSIACVVFFNEADS